jgi:hypothetical protein
MEFLMDKFEGILVYSCIAVIVPVVLARFVVRADWRMIRNACLLWYGFLVIAFGAGTSAEAVGWALIFAMYFSILAVPVIALALRSGGWLARRWRRP